MYRRCLFCQSDLGRNESIESFPVGRRLAFDAAKGRLWAVCTRCGQWNLTPLEERWEAVEECEKNFRDTTRRVQGENIGLAQLRSGLTLVRIGRPQRPEFAAWRYGDQFGKRRRRMVVGGASVALGAAALLTGGALLGVGAAVIPMVLHTAVIVAGMRPMMAALRVPSGADVELLVPSTELPFVRLVARPATEGGWGLDVPYNVAVTPGSRSLFGYSPKAPALATAHLVGLEAQRAAAVILPRINRGGACAPLVRDAVRLIEEAGGPDRWFSAAASRTRAWGAEQTFGDTGSLRYLPASARLALEMAAHEETERRALEGELAELEAQWKSAEEVAAIADGELTPLPATAIRLLSRLRPRG